MTSAPHPAAAPPATAAPTPLTTAAALHDGVSCVIPVYNGAQSLGELVAGITQVMHEQGLPCEIILVNDGSRDASWSVITELAERNPAVRGIDLLKNSGQHNALLIGIRAARQPIIVTLDDDLQHPPSQIPLLLARLAAGSSLVYGVPETLQHGPWRNLAARLAKFLLRRFMGMQGMTESTPFRAFRTQLRQAFVGYNGPYVDIDALLSWATAQAEYVPVRFAERQYGTSAYSFTKLVNHTLNMITNFSVIPLRLANYLGFTATLFGILVLIYVVGRYLVLGSSIPGFPFLASIIAIFAGVQLFSLGIIGEYIIRIHFRTMGKPAAVIRDQVGGPPPAFTDTRGSSA